MSTKKSLKSSTTTFFRVGDLVEYAPYSIHGEGAWVMKGELGIVVGVTAVSSEYEVVRVKWIHNQLETKFN